MTVAGSEWIFPRNPLPAVDAPIGSAQGVVVDTNGNLYVADPYNGMVLRVSAKGVLTVAAGNGRIGFSGDGGSAINAQLNNPTGVAVDRAGNLYIADQHNSRIRRVSVSGAISTVVATTGFPNAVAVDASGNVFVADTLGNQIRKVTADGTITTVAGTGKLGFSGDGGPAIDAMLASPDGVAVDAAGNLYIADFYSGRIRKVALDGTIVTVAGGGPSFVLGDGGPATDAFLQNPRGVAVDGEGNLYIADIPEPLTARTLCRSATAPKIAFVRHRSPRRKLCRMYSTSRNHILILHNFRV